MRIGVFSRLGNLLVQFEASLCLPREKSFKPCGIIRWTLRSS